MAKNELMKVVRDECCYYVRNECIGLEGGKCRIGASEKCGYFYGAILPLFLELRKEYEKLKEVSQSEGDIHN